jgi:hypothetical protein
MPTICLIPVRDCVVRFNNVDSCEGSWRWSHCVSYSVFTKRGLALSTVQDEACSEYVTREPLKL